MADNENYEPVTTEPDSELGKMLYALNGNPVDVPHPTSEFTTILYALLGYAIEVPEPTSEASRLLYQYYIEGGGGSGDYQAKNIEPDFSNGNVVVIPDSEYDALSRVVIEKDADLLASNIKKDVEIFGITGTLENTVPQDLQTDMNSVFNEKFQTSIDYPPEEWAATVELMEPYPTETTSGSVANFSTSLTLPLVSHIVTIDYKDTTGYTGMSIHQRGVNVWDEVWELGNINNTTGANVNNNVRIRSKNYIAVKPSSTITIVNTNEISIFIYQYAKDKSYLGLYPTGLSAGYLTITLPTNCYYLRFRSNDNMIYNANVSFNYPSTDTSYHTYNSASNDSVVNWTDEAGTIYGGSVDITNGTVTSTKAQDGSDLPDPVVTTIDPTIINTLKGVNNIWADTGDTAVEFKLTHQDWVDQHTSPDPNLLTKSAPEEVKEETEEVDTDNR